MSDQEEMTWQSRREKVRQKYYERLTKVPVEEAFPTLSQSQTEGEAPMTPETPGNVPGTAATEAAPSATAAAPAPPSTATSATATVSPAPPTPPSASSTSAESTSPPGDSAMVWTTSPIGLVERTTKLSIVDPSGSLVPGLPTHVLESLQALATGRSEPIEAIVMQIAEFFVEQEDERAEGPLAEALDFYTANYGPPR